MSSGVETSLDSNGLNHESATANKFPRMHTNKTEKAVCPRITRINANDFFLEFFRANSRDSRVCLFVIPSSFVIRIWSFCEHPCNPCNPWFSSFDYGEG